MGGGGQQTCFAEVTCVEASDRQPEGMCGTFTLMRQLGLLEAVVCTRGSRRAGSAGT
jgi:hypothetical protein